MESHNTARLIGETCQQGMDFALSNHGSWVGRDRPIFTLARRIFANVEGLVKSRKGDLEFSGFNGNFLERIAIGK
ncbi:MAG: hypothetical protein JRF20_04710 [Deltaproteobacteria bacterium]|nr:hypothetical protein [Deltaproteobacteria bacterium]MBW2350479.1 hypothetical protein [Deltaproteobacteria bacterium]